MLTLFIALGSLVGYLVAYHTYGRWLARRLFKLSVDAPVPSVTMRDDQDYIPARREVLFGHHFTSIAGTGPIVGPALAVIWGWLPALLWVLIGSVFIGAVHDLGALVVSIRNRGQTIGEVAGRLINPRVKILFLTILFLALTIVLAIFGLVIASIFAMYPVSVFTIWLELPIAVAIGWLLYRRGFKPYLPAIVALVLMIGALVAAVYWPQLQWVINPLEFKSFTLSPVVVWTALLLVYCYVASTLPVWVLLQPRDYINGNKLVLSLVLLIGGIGAATLFSEAGAPMVAPAVRASPPGAPPMMPFLFITIACGAISGFHCLVSSGTTSKQIACETHAQFIGYGSMLTEGFLAVLVILACCAGLGMRRDAPAFPTNLPTMGIPLYTEDLLCSVGSKNAYVYPSADQMRIDDFHPATSGLGSLSQSDLSNMTKSRVVHELAIGEHYDFGYGRIEMIGPHELMTSGPINWIDAYYDWSSAGGLANSVRAFVTGSGNFVAALGIPRPVALGLMAVLVASFAATTLDTATRLQRYVIQELADTLNVRALTGKHAATFLAVSSAAALAIVPPPGSSWATGMGTGGLLLWPLFGAVNQLLAGLSFIVVAIYLVRRKLPTWFLVLPMILMLVTPMAAMLYQIFSRGDPIAGTGRGWLAAGQYHLVAGGLFVCLLEVWMIVEAAILWPKVRGVLETDKRSPQAFPAHLVSDE